MRRQLQALGLLAVLLVPVLPGGEPAPDAPSRRAIASYASSGPVRVQLDPPHIERRASRSRRQAQTQVFTAPSPSPTPKTGQLPSDSSGTTIWNVLANCETEDYKTLVADANWHDPDPPYYGGLQFTLSSWRGVGGRGLPNQASREEQIMRGKRLQAIQGWGAWPGCARKLGLL